MLLVRKHDERGHANHGWLDTYHTFSFADYHDPNWVSFRALRVINDDRVDAGMGFGMHPHRDMEIITYILSGSLRHEDSMGNARSISAGEFQYMSAGKGVRHSEVNPSSTDPVHLLQIWITPDEQGAQPRYADASFKNAEPGKLHLAASKNGREGSIAIRQDVNVWLGKFGGGEKVELPLAPGRHAWIHVAEGNVRVNGMELNSGDSLGATEETNLTIEGLSPAQLLVFDLN
ncbi:MAG: pirin family protein [Verrucomicrobiales bacterium]